VNVRAAAQRRQAKRLHYASASRLAALSHETGVPVDVLRTFAGISDPRNAHRFAVASFHARREITWSVGAELARGASTVMFPVPPEAGDWLTDPVHAHRITLPPALDAEAEHEGREALEQLAAIEWEPPRVELPLEPADLSDEPSPPPPPVYADINPPKLNLKKLRALAEKKPKP
jgi:hypothetical protein